MSFVLSVVGDFPIDSKMSVVVTSSILSICRLIKEILATDSMQKT
jgi:hypothetical protein